MRNEVLSRAAELGRECGAAAAAWCEFSEWRAEDLDLLLNDVDPMIMDRFNGPNLSGEWADDPTPGSLADDIGVRRDSRIMDEACTTWEDNAADVFWCAVMHAAEREYVGRELNDPRCVDDR